MLSSIYKKWDGVLATVTANNHTNKLSVTENVALPVADEQPGIIADPAGDVLGGPPALPPQPDFDDDLVIPDASHQWLNQLSPAQKTNCDWKQHPQDIYVTTNTRTSTAMPVSRPSFTTDRTAARKPSALC